MSTPTTREVTPDLDVPVIIALAQATEILPDRASQTIYRWRLPRNGKPAALPPPFAICARTPLYRIETILEVAKLKNARVDQKVVNRIYREQGRQAPAKP